MLSQNEKSQLKKKRKHDFLPITMSHFRTYILLNSNITAFMRRIGAHDHVIAINFVTE